MSCNRLEREGLLDTADLDFNAFFDSEAIRKSTPAMSTSSPLFYALVVHVHYREMNHSGVEATLARIRQSFHPMGQPRRIITAVKKACTRCRRALRQVVDSELADVHPWRITFAPPFYAVMMDIAMGFRAKPTKDSRKCFTANALVIVCLLTSATSIMVLDGLETQCVVSALERHSSRYGVPGHVCVDAGTQLEKLKDTSCELRDVTGHVSTGR